MKENIRYFSCEDNTFAVEIGGKSWCDGSYRIRRAASEVWVLEYILAGSGTVTLDGRTCHPKCGDVYLLPPGRNHLYYSCADDPWIKVFVNCKGTIVNALADAYGLSGRVLFPAVGSDIKAMFSELYGMMEDRTLAEDFVLGRAELLIHGIFRELGRHHMQMSETQKEVKIVKEYLNLHVSELVPLGDMAAQIYRSPDYLIKHFKAETGMTPYRYLLRQKMKIACLLLKETRMPLLDISRHLGYDDPHYFSNLFKKEQGLPPAGYRKQFRP